MNKQAYELGVGCAMIDAGLMEKQALNPLMGALLGGGAGAAGGAALANEGRGLEGALAGAGMGAGAGLLGTLGAKGIGKLRGALRGGKVNTAVKGLDKALGRTTKAVGKGETKVLNLDKAVDQARKKVQKLRFADAYNPPTL